MREPLLWWFTPTQLEAIGLGVLIVGLCGELFVLFVSEERHPKLLKSLMAVFTVMVIAGVWIEHVGSDENKAPRRIKGQFGVKLTQALQPIPAATFVLMTDMGAEPLHFGMDIARVLQKFGWSWRSYEGDGIKITPLDGSPAIGFSILRHIEIQALGFEYRKTASALEKAFKSVGIEDVRVVASEREIAQNERYIRLIVGSKP